MKFKETVTILDLREYCRKFAYEHKHSIINVGINEETGYNNFKDYKNALLLLIKVQIKLYGVAYK